MNCAYHARNQAVVNCSGCGKSLCAGCDHRIKGFPYCQDCIVTGVQMLQNRFQNPGYVPQAKKQSSPMVATFLSMVCPGLGAAYNGQTSKALIYFGVFVGLFQMAVMTIPNPIFVFGFIGMWAFSALDAWRTAQSIRSGVSVENAEDILVKRFTGSPKTWGIVLAVLGGLSFAYTLGFKLPFRGILPVFLALCGFYILWDSFVKKKDRENEFANQEIRGNLGSESSYKTSFRTGDVSGFDREKTQNEAKNWRSS
jgi:hypothetical protein